MFIQDIPNFEWRLIYNTMYEQASCRNYVCKYSSLHENNSEKKKYLGEY